jgi:hypothetical protein
MDFTFLSPRPFSTRRLTKEGEINTADTITIRRAGPQDRMALARLAGRDSTVLPDDDFLIAEVAGEAWAAIGLRTCALAADPFRPSGQVAELLRMRVDRTSRHAGVGGPTAALSRVAPESPACS